MSGEVELVVSGIGVVCPQAASPAEIPMGGPRARTAAGDDWFDVRTALGPRGYKYLPPAAQYLLAAARRAVADAGPFLEAVGEEQRGAAAGTNSGVAALHDQLDRTVVDANADDISPLTAPFFSVNLLASQLSLHHGIKGFNLTLTSPVVAGLEAVEVGSRFVAMGRSRVLMAGATEAEVRGEAPGTGSDEAGAAVLVLESADAALARGARVYGSCRVRTLFLPPQVLTRGGDREAARNVVIDARRALGDGAAELPVAAELDGSLVSTVVKEALASGPALVHETRNHRGDRPHSEAGCLGPTLHLAGTLARGQPDHLYAVATGEGNVALVRISTSSDTRTFTGKRTATAIPERHTEGTRC